MASSVHNKAFSNIVPVRSCAKGPVFAGSRKKSSPDTLSALCLKKINITGHISDTCRTSLIHEQVLQLSSEELRRFQRNNPSRDLENYWLIHCRRAGISSCLNKSWEKTFELSTRERVDKIKALQKKTAEKSQQLQSSRKRVRVCNPHSLAEKKPCLPVTPEPVAIKPPAPKPPAAKKKNSPPDITRWSYLGMTPQMRTSILSKTTPQPSPLEHILGGHIVPGQRVRKSRIGCSTK
nr:hypothetical protein [Salmonid herpesvirus 1]